MLSQVAYKMKAKKLGETLRFNIVFSNVQRVKVKCVAIFSVNPHSQMSSDWTTLEKRYLHAVKLGDQCSCLQTRQVVMVSSCLYQFHVFITFSGI